ncbi:MAG: septal ring lytic transglycosylase RlpA family protein [bacterium]|nr:septal ring lytic transglycosylase RlpA family protein [bacterium]
MRQKILIFLILASIVFFHSCSTTKDIQTEPSERPEQQETEPSERPEQQETEPSEQPEQQEIVDTQKGPVVLEKIEPKTKPSKKFITPAPVGEIFQTGMASWYGGEFQGRRTANGEIYDMYKLTAAHKTLAFNTILEVENLNNGKRIRVRVNDRGPFVKGRILDLSYKAAQRLGCDADGTAPVTLRRVKPTDIQTPRRENTKLVSHNHQKTGTGKTSPPTIPAAAAATTANTSNHILRAGTEHSTPKPTTSTSPTSNPPAKKTSITNSPVAEPVVKYTPEVIDEEPISEPSRVKTQYAASTKTETPTLKRKDQPVKKDTLETLSVKYYLQAGAFSTQENAGKMLKNIKLILPKTPFKILSQDGLHKVISSGQATRKAAEKLKRILHDIDIEAFIKEM